MGSAPISLGFLLTSLAAVLSIETVMPIVGEWLEMPRLWLILLSRLMQTASVLLLATRMSGGWQALGLDKKTLGGGLKKGLLWSAGFAVFAAFLFAGLFVIGQNPFSLIRMPLPSTPAQIALFFFVGGIVAPIFEEILFRGLIFGAIRRWNVVAAVILSTALFAACHLPAIPVTQVVGGAVFAIAYHFGGSLMTPIVIHMLGNLAIFSLSLLSLS